MRYTRRRNNRKRSKRGGTSLTRGDAAADIDSTITKLEDEIKIYKVRARDILAKARTYLEGGDKTRFNKEMAMANKIKEAIVQKNRLINTMKKTKSTMNLADANAMKLKSLPSGNNLLRMSRATMGAERAEMAAHRAAHRAAQREAAKTAREAKREEAKTARAAKSDAMKMARAAAMEATPGLYNMDEVSNVLAYPNDLNDAELEAELDALAYSNDPNDAELEAELDALAAEEVLGGGKKNKTRKVRRKKRKTCKKGKKCKKRRRRSTRRRR